MKINIYKETDSIDKKSNPISLRNIRRGSLAETFLFRSSQKSEITVKPTEYELDRLPDRSVQQCYQYSQPKKAPEGIEQVSKENLITEVDEAFETKPIDLSSKPKNKSGNNFFVAILLTILFSANFIGMYLVYETVQKVNIKSEAITEIKDDIQVLDSEIFFLNETIKNGLIDKKSFLDELSSKFKEQTKSIRRDSYKRYLLIKNSQKKQNLARKQKKKEIENRIIRKRASIKKQESANKIKNRKKKTFMR